MRNIRHSSTGLLIRTYYKCPFTVRLFLQKIFKALNLWNFFSSNELVTQSINGITYELDLNELIDSSIYYRHSWEPLTTNVVSKLVKEGMITVDVGANIGYFTLLLAKLVGERGRVYAFEPTDRGFVRLCHNVELNKFRNIQLEKKALSNVTSSSKAAIQSSFPLKTNTDGKENREEVIEFLTLDDYTKNHDITRIDFIKVDTDGFEHRVIQGSARTIGEMRPIIVSEFGKYTLAKNQDSLEEMYNSLQRMGYEFYSEDSMERYRDVKHLLDSVPETATINVICRPLIRT
ncbi:MAG: FkbM family methyltransferase [Nitrososphaerales archaeon]